MRAKIYAALVVISLLLGAYFFGIVNESNAERFVWVSLIPFFLFVAGVHGLLAQSKLRERPFYPFFMGVLYAALLLLHVYLMMNKLCPCFMNP